MLTEEISENNLKDYSGDPDWEECRKVFARSQQEFPTALGTWRVLQLKRQLYGRTPLYRIPPKQFKELNQAKFIIWALRVM